MLNHIPMHIPPVIENLGTKNMSPNAPNSLIPLFRKPLVTKLLGVYIVDLEGAVVDMRGGIRTHEEGMVVHQILATVDMREDGYCFFGFASFHVEEVCWDDVEVLGVEVEFGLEVLDAEAVVAELDIDVSLVKPRSNLLFHTLKTSAGPGFSLMNLRERGFSIS